MDKQVTAIGRTVHFVPPSNEHPTGNNDAKVVPAIITKVHSDTCVNLTVFPDGREPQFCTSVNWRNDGEPFSWYWPQQDAEAVAKAQVDAAKNQAPPANPVTEEESKSAMQE